MDFGKKLKSLRLKENMTQSLLAERLGLSKAIISAYESGIRMPSYYVLIRISRIFKVSTDYLLGVELKNKVDLSGLSDEEAEAILNLIKVMKNNFAKQKYFESKFFDDSNIE